MLTVRQARLIYASVADSRVLPVHVVYARAKDIAPRALGQACVGRALGCPSAPASSHDPFPSVPSSCHVLSSTWIRSSTHLEAHTVYKLPDHPNPWLLLPLPLPPPLQRMDQMQHSEGRNDTYWFAPIVADAEAGFGGNLNAYEVGPPGLLRLATPCCPVAGAPSCASSRTRGLRLKRCPFVTVRQK